MTAPPEPPDFDQILKPLIDKLSDGMDPDNAADFVRRTMRQVWNARPVSRCDQCRYLGPWIPAQRAFECQAIRHTSDESPRPSTARVQVDYEVAGYGGRLLIQPDFGCIQWERKPDA